MAIAIIRNLTEIVLGNNQDPARFNFLQEMRNQIAQAVRNSDQQRSDLNRKIARCDALANRFKAKDGDNLIAKILNGRIEEMERQVAAVERDRANLEAAGELLKAYEYETDPVPQTAASTYGMGLGRAFASAQSGSWMNQ